MAMKDVETKRCYSCGAPVSSVSTSRCEYCASPFFKKVSDRDLADFFNQHIWYFPHFDVNGGGGGTGCNTIIIHRQEEKM